MKRTLFFIVAFVMGTAVFADWNKFAYMGFAIPMTTTSVEYPTDNDTSWKQTSYGAEIAGVLAHTSGISFKFAFDFGFGQSDDYFAENDSTGLEGEVKGGLGYTFINNDLFQLSLFGMAGVGLLRYKYENSLNINITLMEIWATAGADALFAVTFTPKLSFYANVGVYKIFPRDIEFKMENLKTTIPATGGYRIVPSIGIKTTL